MNFRILYMQLKKQFCVYYINLQICVTFNVNFTFIKLQEGTFLNEKNKDDCLKKNVFFHDIEAKFDYWFIILYNEHFKKHDFFTIINQVLCY